MNNDNIGKIDISRKLEVFGEIMARALTQKHTPKEVIKRLDETIADIEYVEQIRKVKPTQSATKNKV